MDNARKAHIDEMERLTDAMHKTKSPQLKRDYAKALVRMKKELNLYDMYMEKFAKERTLITEASNG